MKIQMAMSRQMIRKGRFNQIRMMTCRTLSMMCHQSGLHKTSTSRTPYPTLDVTLDLYQKRFSVRTLSPEVCVAPNNKMDPAALSFES